MAEHGFDTKDFVAHERTYDGFIGLFKYGMIAVAIVVVLVILLITR